MKQTMVVADKEASSDLSAAGALAANRVLEAFSDFHAEFQLISRGAKAHFERRAWRKIHQDAEARLELHGKHVYAAIGRLKDSLGATAEDRELWRRAKEEYTALIDGHGAFEIAQTFFNSVSMRLVRTPGIDAEIQFTGGEVQTSPVSDDDLAFELFHRPGTTEELIRGVLEAYRFECPYRSLEESAARVAGEIDAYLPQIGWESEFTRLDVARPVFYRGQLAFVVARICSPPRYTPIVLALANTPEGVTVDAVLLTEDEVSILFSFARWYFHVDVEKPFALVRFLKTILPKKPVAELYISLGYNKHGKTELYRDLMRHLSRSDDLFEIAAGARGMVMVVFTLPSYDVVFKVIKDRFDYPKSSTRAEVENRYNLVFKHDRGGRLVDAQEFTYLRFPVERFAPDLLKELLEVAAQTVSVEGEQVLIKHVYTERRLVPLNIYLVEAPEEQAIDAVIDLGQAIKDLAATNIFPGDILLKNFGVTRHGRVVFYDYDELCLLTDCQFREMPQAEDPFDEMADEPWYSVGPHDVFPEEMHQFLLLPPRLKEVFAREHGELFALPFWEGLKRRYEAGQVIDVIPYREQRRLDG